MLLGLLGDVHGDFGAIERAMAREPGVVAWLSVGDIGSETGAYPTPSQPFFFIKGNNEDFDVVARLAAGEPVAPNLHLLPNGEPILIQGVRVAGLGGTFAPKWYDTAAADLPAAGGGRKADLSRRSPAGAKADDKRRHFVRAEVEACLALTGVDVFLTHEAPRPYWVGAGRRRNDAGKAVINDILTSMRPRLHVFGHHHARAARVVEGVPSLGLPLASAGYLLVHTDAWTWEFKPLVDS